MRIPIKYFRDIWLALAILYRTLVEYKSDGKDSERNKNGEQVFNILQTVDFFRIHLFFKKKIIEVYILSKLRSCPSPNEQEREKWIPDVIQVLGAEFLDWSSQEGEEHQGQGCKHDNLLHEPSRNECTEPGRGSDNLSQIG